MYVAQGGRSSAVLRGYDEYIAKVVDGARVLRTMLVDKDNNRKTGRSVISMKNSPVKPWYKRWKPWAYVFAFMFVVGIILPDMSEETAEPAAKESLTQTKSDEELAAEKANEERAAERAAKIAEVEPVSTDGTVQPVQTEPTPTKPLTKDEVLAKFPIVAGEEPYINGTFAFVGNRTDTADYYALEDTDRYRNASVIFKDGEIARVKLIPEGDADVNELFAEFGITEKPRELGGMIKSYEVALIPMYWSQNIERYPFESEY